MDNNKDSRLDAYEQKRDFDSTSEPRGASDCSAPPDRAFVLQYHVASRPHYDFRLEWQGVLLSWAVPKGPSLNPQEKRLAIRVEDHPLEYRNFEGVIPKGQYGGGTVMLFDEGIWLPQPNFAEGLKKNSIKFILMGTRLKGKWVLIKTHSSNWLLIKEQDEFAQTTNSLSSFTKSIRTNRSIEEIT